MSAPQPPPVGQHAVVATESSFVDAWGIEIFTYSWVADDPIAAVYIAHGIGEHARRYDEFAHWLASFGFAVYVNDHRGHGETGRAQWAGDLSQLGKLGPGGLRAAEQAIEQYAGWIREQHPSLQLMLLAHSWGSLMAQRILNRGTGLFDAVVLSGSAYRVPGFMESGDLNKRHAHLGTTGYEWLSRDASVAAAFAADELCFSADVLERFGPVDGLRLFGVPNSRVPLVPLLIISGADDPLARRDSLERLAASYRNRGLRDVTLKVYAGARHELLNETNRSDVFDYVLAWMLQRVRDSNGDSL